MTIVLNGTTGITDVNGTAAAPALTGTDTDTGIFFPAANTLAFSTNGTEDARFDSAGNFGIGVTPSAWVSGSVSQTISNAVVARRNNGASVFGHNFYESAANTFTYTQTGVATRIEAPTSGGLTFNTAPSGSAGTAITFTQAMTLFANGNLSIGSTTSAGTTRVAGIEGTSSAYFQFGRTNATSGGGLVGTDIGPGIQFYTYTGSFGSESYTERARIDSSGSFFVGTSTTWLSSAAYKQGGVQVGNASYAAIVGQAGGVARYGLFYDAANTYLTVTSGGTFYVYNTTNGVYLSANATSWTSNSDERLKDIIEPITNAASKVSSLRAVIGKYKTDEEGTRRSFLIAQDVQAVLPEAVTESQSKDQEQSYLGVQYTDVIPLLVAAIKEQQAIITQLQADVAALKA